MDWKSLSAGILAAQTQLKHLPQRAGCITALTTVLDGTLYDHMGTPYVTEVMDSGEYIPQKQRRPSVRSGLCRTVVDDSVALLFSEGHFPTLHSEDETTRQALADLVSDRRLNETFIDAATRGSVGSAAILFRVLKGKTFFDVMPSAFLTPTWDPEEPDTLLKVTERYTLRGKDLAAKGYTVSLDDQGKLFFFQREWTSDEETWFVPWPVTTEPVVPVRDANLSVRHGLGFVPMVWIRNLPGGDEIDGECTFKAAIDTVIRIDYTLSQAGRALDYAGDPKLVVMGQDGGVTGLGSGAANAIFVTSDGDAKLLEINGGAATASLDYVRYLRALALESIHGNRTDADKLATAQSGRAMELMNQGLIWLADKLRIAYGQYGLLCLARMVCRASDIVETGKGGLMIAGKRYKGLKADGLSLVWPRWYAPTADDRQSEAGTLSTLTSSALMSRETAVRVLAATYDIEDADAELLLIAADEKAADEREAKLAAVQTKVTASLPA
jgi:hypothetical protein